MFKALGIILVGFSLGLFTYKNVEVKKQQLFNLKEISKALTFLKHELSFSVPEISMLCKKIGDNTVGEISCLYNDIGNSLANDSRMNFSDVWQKAVGEKKLFSNEAEKEILDFSKNFGKKTLDIELENIEKTQKALEVILNKEEEKYQKDKKLMYTLSAAVGAAIVILAI